MSDSKVVILGGKSIPLPKRAAMQVIPFIHASIPEQETWPDPDTKEVLKPLTNALKEDLNGGIQNKIMVESLTHQAEVTSKENSFATMKQTRKDLVEDAHHKGELLLDNRSNYEEKKRAFEKIEKEYNDLQDASDLARKKVMLHQSYVESSEEELNEALQRQKDFDTKAAKHDFYGGGVNKIDPPQCMFATISPDDFYNFLEASLKEEDVSLEQDLAKMTVRQRIAFRRYLRNCGYEENEYCKGDIRVSRIMKYHSGCEDQSTDLERTLSYLPPRPNTQLVVRGVIAQNGVSPLSIKSPSFRSKRTYESILASDPELACFSPSPVHRPKYK